MRHLSTSATGAKMSERIEGMRVRLLAAMPDARIDIVDEGHLHVGHAGARDGRGHFRLTIHSRTFAGMAALARHRMIYAALGDMLDTDIHALAISAHALEDAT